MIEKPELFVIAPFGSKDTSLTEAPTIDFDDVFNSLIAPVAENRGWSVSRGDQLFAPAAIIDSIIRALYSAQLVIADITLPNGNVFYELGIRHAIAAGGTLLIAHIGAAIPFDVAHRRVLFYDLQRPLPFRKDLAAAMERNAVEASQQDLGVRDALERLGVITGAKDPLRFEQDFSARIERAETSQQLIGVWQWARQHEHLPPRLLSELARRFQRQREWKGAAEVLERAVQESSDDFELQRNLGWTLKRLGRPSEAEKHLKIAIELNRHDAEAWGMLGGLYKEQRRLPDAADAYKASLAVGPDDEYALVNLAGIEVLLGGERREAGIDRYRKLLEAIESRSMVERDVWTELNAGEALFILGQDERARASYVAIAKRPGVTWEFDLAMQQLLKFASVDFRPEAARTLVGEVMASRSTPGTAGSSPPPAEALVGPVGRTGHAADSQTIAVGPTAGGSELSTSSRGAPQQRPPVFLHLSDLHFGSRIVAGKSEPMHRFVKSDSGKSLLEHIVDEVSTFSFEPERMHLVISGDLTYTATADEFKQVAEFIDGVCAALKIDKDRVAVVPGNHDVSWPAAAYNQARRYDQYLIFLRKLYGKDRAAKLYPRIDWSLDPEIPVNGSDLFAFHPLANGTVELVCLNSCVHESESKHWGFVGETQLEKVGRVLPPIADQNKLPVRVAVMHHHLHVFPEAQDAHVNEPWVDVSVARDAGVVERWIEEQGFAILMHGHKHKPQLRETIIRGFRQNRDEDGRPLIVCGAGSAGVHPRELEPNFGNHFEIVELLRTPRSLGADFTRITWRELPTDSTVFWSKRPPWVLKG